MAIIALKAWYLASYEPARELENRPHDLRLSKNSLLKSALRADFLDDSADVRQTEWFQRYLDGETVEFYVEGSGGYAIANIDLISHEIYFTKQEVMAHLEPSLFFCYQTQVPAALDPLQAELLDIVADLNRQARIPLTLEQSHRLSDGPARLGSKLTRKIRKSLLFIADGTPITQLEGSPPLLVPSPQVCVETGYALQAKRTDQILLVQLEQGDGQFPFDLPAPQRLRFTDRADLHRHLPALIRKHLDRFNLFPHDPS